MRTASAGRSSSARDNTTSQQNLLKASPMIGEAFFIGRASRDAPERSGPWGPGERRRMGAGGAKRPGPGSTLMDFSKLDGLIPAVVQDENTNDVLMVGFMNREALDRTMA